VGTGVEDVRRRGRDVLRHAWACAYDRQPFHSGGAFGKLAAVTAIDGDTETRRTQIVR
jgi:hypothetical protein